MMNSQSSPTVGATHHKPTGPAIRIFTPREAAEVLKLSISWLAKARMRGDGPAYIQIGRSIRYREEDLIEWMKARLRPSSGEKGHVIE